VSIRLLQQQRLKLIHSLCICVSASNLYLSAVIDVAKLFDSLPIPKVLAYKVLGHRDAPTWQVEQRLVLIDTVLQTLRVS